MKSFLTAVLIVTVALAGLALHMAITRPDEWKEAMDHAGEDPIAKYESTERALSAVRERLRDPDSANFRKLRTTPSGTVCGEMNARNGFGGYMGFEPFAVAFDPETGEAFAYLERQDFVSQLCEG